MRKIIIDADPGTDDFIAISLAIKSNIFDILGITTVEGNCTLDNAIKNTFKVLDMCKRNDIEVYKGLTNHELGTDSAEDVHGTNGLGEVEYTPIDREVNSKSAIDFIIDTINNNPGEVTLVCLGPLTNIAAAIKKDHSFVKNTKELVIMGGSRFLGNITPYAEFNFHKDPKAVDIVIGAGFENVTVIGWDRATRTALLPEYEGRLKNSNNELMKFIYDITRTTAERDKDAYGGAVISDAVVIGYLIDPSIITLEDADMDIIRHGKKAGQSDIELTNKDSNCKYVVKIDSEKFYDLFFDVLAR